MLASWAVPKGPSTDPSVRRLAKQVGDHDLAHAGVEGKFGRRNVVQVWDRGTCSLTKGDVASGHLSFVLDGEKLTGAWSLIRTREGPDWLLLKKRDATANDDPVVTRPESVLSGRTMDEIACS